MSLEEFLKHIYFTKNYIVIPALDREKLKRELFVNNKNQVNMVKLNEFLTKLYTNNYGIK